MDISLESQMRIGAYESVDTQLIINLLLIEYQLSVNWDVNQVLIDSQWSIKQGADHPLIEGIHQHSTMDDFK